MSYAYLDERVRPTGSDHYINVRDALVDLADIRLGHLSVDWKRKHQLRTVVKLAKTNFDGMPPVSTIISGTDVMNGDVVVEKIVCPSFMSCMRQSDMEQWFRINRFIPRPNSIWDCAGSRYTINYIVPSKPRSDGCWVLYHFTTVDL